MKDELIYIINLESKKEFESAFNSYESLYSNHKDDFEIWKHFYFYLWIVIENMPNEFVEKIMREKRLKEMFDEGKLIFSEKAEFNFIVGYTISIFPYEFGDYEEFEKLGSKLITKAKNLEPSNPIYEMVYLSDIDSEESRYEIARKEAILKVLEKYNGIGLLNDYFRQVLNRVN